MHLIGAEVEVSQRAACHGVRHVGRLGLFTQRIPPHLHPARSVACGRLQGALLMWLFIGQGIDNHACPSTVGCSNRHMDGLQNCLPNMDNELASCTTPPAMDKASPPFRPGAPIHVPNTPPPQHLTCTLLPYPTASIPRWLMSAHSTGAGE